MKSLNAKNAKIFYNDFIKLQQRMQKSNTRFIKRNRHVRILRQAKRE